MIKIFGFIKDLACTKSKDHTIITIDEVRNNISKRNAEIGESGRYDIPLIIAPIISEKPIKIYITKSIATQKITMVDEKGTSLTEALYNTYEALKDEVDLEHIVISMIYCLSPDFVYFNGPFSIDMLTALHIYFDMEPFEIDLE